MSKKKKNAKKQRAKQNANNVFVSAFDQQGSWTGTAYNYNANAQPTVDVDDE